MLTETDDRLRRSDPEDVSAQIRMPRRGAWRDDVAALRPTLLVVGGLIIIALIAVTMSLIFYSSGAGAINVAETDYRITMPKSLRAGHHNVSLTNNGKIGHELLLFRTDLNANALPVDANGDVKEDAPVLHNALDSGDALAPGGNQSLSVTLSPGHYVAVCNLAGHYHSGMRLNLTVTR